jgi:cytochrome c oxidase cbb3-type subunit 3
MPARRLLFLLLFVAACDREDRTFRDSPPAAMGTSIVTMTPQQPGGSRPPVTVANAYEENAWAIAEGKRLYDQFNCTGCHAHGGGAIGPALMDDQWIYGVSPENIYSTIVQGRPNGMPSFSDKLSSQQVWQLVAYVRSMSGLVNKDVRTGRDDDMQVKQQEQSKSTERPKQSFMPPGGERP